MAASIRQRWDTVNDCAKVGRASEGEEYAAYVAATSRPIPEYRFKMVHLPHGQTEVSVTPTNKNHVIARRMGFDPLLDCPRKSRTPEEQAERDAEHRERSAKRARQRVRWLVKCIAADHMLTFSYRENMEDRERLERDWKAFVRLFRVRYPEWRYVIVPETQDRGSLHVHVAVAGKQDIRWLLRCWLLAIGQPAEDVSAWLLDGKKLGDKSLGAVNVEGPKNRGGVKWRRNQLAGYLTKYFSKAFDEVPKGAKKYWHSHNADKPRIERGWLRATNWLEAVEEAHDMVYFTGATSLSMWGDSAAGVVWITGETERDRIGRCSQGVCELDD